MEARGYKERKVSWEMTGRRDKMGFPDKREKRGSLVRKVGSNNK